MLLLLELVLLKDLRMEFSREGLERGAGVLRCRGFVVVLASAGGLVVAAGVLAVAGIVVLLDSSWSFFVWSFFLLERCHFQY